MKNRQTTQYCIQCGKYFERYTETCPKCHTTVSKAEAGDPNMLFLAEIFSMIIPIIGVIIYFVKRKTKPYLAKQAILWSGIGLVVEIILSFIF